MGSNVRQQAIGGIRRARTLQDTQQGVGATGAGANGAVPQANTAAPQPSPAVPQANTAVQQSTPATSMSTPSAGGMGGIRPATSQYAAPEGWNPNQYLANYSDLRNAQGLDPLQHYMEHGQSEGRSYMAPAFTEEEKQYLEDAYRFTTGQGTPTGLGAGGLGGGSQDQANQWLARKQNTPEDQWWEEFAAEQYRTNPEAMKGTEFGQQYDKQYQSQQQARKDYEQQARDWITQSYTGALQRSPSEQEVQQYLARIMAGESPEAVQADMMNAMQSEYAQNYNKQFKATKGVDDILEQYRQQQLGAVGSGNPLAFTGGDWQDFYNENERNKIRGQDYGQFNNWGLGLENTGRTGFDMAGYSLRQPIEDVLGNLGWQFENDAEKYKRLNAAFQPGSSQFADSGLEGYIRQKTGNPGFNISPNTADAYLVQNLIERMAEQGGYDTGRMQQLFSSPQWQQYLQESAGNAGKRQTAYNKVKQAQTGGLGLKVLGAFLTPLMAGLPAIAGAGIPGVSQAAQLAGMPGQLVSKALSGLTGAVGGGLSNAIPALPQMGQVMRALSTLKPAMTAMKGGAAANSMNIAPKLAPYEQKDYPSSKFQEQDYRANLPAGIENVRKAVPGEPKFEAEVGKNVPNAEQLEQYITQKYPTAPRIRKSMTSGVTPSTQREVPQAEGQEAAPAQVQRILNDLQIPDQAKRVQQLPGNLAAFVRRPGSVAGVYNSYGHPMMAAKRPKMQNANPGLSVKGGQLSVRSAIPSGAGSAYTRKNGIMPEGQSGGEEQVPVTVDKLKLRRAR